MNHPVLFQVTRTAVGAIPPGGPELVLTSLLFKRAGGAVPEG